MAKKKKVRQGECLCSIAAEAGFPSAAALQQASENEPICRARPNPNVLAPGDEVFLPTIQPRTVTAAAGQELKLVRTQEQTFVRLVLVSEAGTPWSTRPWQAFYADEVLERTEQRSGTTRSDGSIELEVPAYVDALRIDVRLGDDAASVRTLTLDVGHLDPVTEISGVQARLANLGYDCGVDGRWGPQSEAALKVFQHDAGMAESGTVDHAVRDRLVQEHGV